MKLCESARSFGTEGLSLSELITLSAQSWAGNDDIGRRILSEFEPHELLQADRSDLEARANITAAQAAALRCSLDLASKLHAYTMPKQEITSPEDAALILMHDLRRLDREHFYTLCLNTKNYLVRRALVSIGTLNSALVHPREAFKPAIQCSAASVVFVHNHPSGDPTPSREDIELTKQLMRAGTLLGIEVIDHIVIGDGVWVSLKERGLI